MSDSEKSQLQQVLKKLDDLAEETAIIKRGLYGDPKNKVRGLIDRQDQDEERITKIENRQTKSIAIVTGFATGLTFVIEFVIRFFKDRI
jgi:hypothetical protein